MKTRRTERGAKYKEQNNRLEEGVGIEPTYLGLGVWSTPNPAGSPPVILVFPNNLYNKYKFKWNISAKSFSSNHL